MFLVELITSSFLHLIYKQARPQWRCKRVLVTLGTLSKDVFERRASTGSEVFSLFICLDANKLVLLSFFSLLKTIYPRVSTKPLPNDAKSPLPVDVRHSKTLLLKLPIKDQRRRKLNSKTTKVSESTCCKQYNSGSRGEVHGVL